ncbi:MAG: molybdopterin-dependent oxidoreductase [Proteobacteria bacterium]|nr:molybdopterin-dependent oxidoreductase [Pseudomonadota bacterium]
MNRLSELMIARRDLLKGSGALLVTMNVPAAALLGSSKVEARAVTRKLNPAQLDTWLAIDGNGIVTGYWGKMDMGQGVDTAIAQLIAEELDVPVDKVNIVFGDTALCADQGGASGSTGVQRSGVAFQAAAADARLVLLEKASAELEVPVADLYVSDGVIHAKNDRAKSVSYGMLIADELFDTPIKWNGKYGNELSLKGRAKLKNPRDYKIVGTSVRRHDIAGKIFATTEFLHHVNVPGMLHGRMIRPIVAGARVRSVDQRSVKDIPGVQVVVKNDFVGVVAPKEWDAIKAARALKVEWDESGAGFPTNSDDLFNWIRSTEPAMSTVEQEEGNVDDGIAGAARIITAEYEWPFQSHARMAPAAAVADVRDDHAVIWTDSQKPYDTARGAALLLESPLLQGRTRRRSRYVRAIWMPGPGSYGRSDAGDGAMDAVILSDTVGAPVRVQWMRSEGHAWDPKGPASVVTCRAGLDARGNVIAYHFHIKGFSRHDLNSREDDPSEVLAGHLLGHTSTPEWTMRTPDDSYKFQHKRYSWDALAPLRREASPLRTSHFRDPYGAEVHYAAESFVDEMAMATGTDPLAFRLRHVTDPRDAAVLKAAGELAAWETRTAPRKNRGANGSYVGTGIAYARRNGAVNAVVAEVEVNANSGRVWVRRMWVGADYGLIVNPFTLDRTIEGNLLQAASRTLFEEVKFNDKMVESDDWESYPILEASDAPKEIKIAHINRPELGPRGAGEPATRVAPPAIANAFFDATGVRMRRVPLTPERVKVALQAI